MACHWIALIPLRCSGNQAAILLEALVLKTYTTRCRRQPTQWKWPSSSSSNGITAMEPDSPNSHPIRTTSTMLLPRRRRCRSRSGRLVNGQQSFGNSSSSSSKSQAYLSSINPYSVRVREGKNKMVIGGCFHLQIKTSIFFSDWIEMSSGSSHKDLKRELLSKTIAR